MNAWPLVVLIGALASLPVVGCGASRGEVALLRDELARVERDHEALARRVGELDTHAEAEAGPERRGVAARTPAPSDSAAPSASAASSTGYGPPRELRVVKLRPALEVAAPPALDATTEEEHEGEVRPLLTLGPGDRSTSMAASETAIRRELETVRTLAKQQKHQLALESIASFVARHPDHELVWDALLLRARCYRALGNLTAAETELEELASRPADPVRTPSVLAELAAVQLKAGAPQRAEETSARLRREFPQSAAARRSAPPGAKKEGAS